jgi:hypothetical protein
MSLGSPMATALAGVVLAATLAYHTATGTLEGYDPEARVLTVRSATGSSEFQVASDARAFLGNRRLVIGELVKHVGAQVTVAWSQEGDVRSTHTVRIAVGRAGREK